jgi:hypothetical protein
VTIKKEMFDENENPHLEQKLDSSGIEVPHLGQFTSFPQNNLTKIIHTKMVIAEDNSQFKPLQP